RSPASSLLVALACRARLPRWRQDGSIASLSHLQEGLMQPGSRRSSGATRSAHGVFDRYIFSGAPMDNNVYLLICTRTRDAILIDASGDAEQILKEIRQAQARVRMILMTHGHADHWGALGRLRDALGASVGIHLADADMLPLTPNFALADGQRI